MDLNKDQPPVAEPISKSSGRTAVQDIEILKWLGCHPRWAVVVVAVLAVIISSYPVIFCGKSYVSPASCAFLISGQFPFAPGMERNMYHDQHLSDTFATMWWGVPAGFIESRSILDHGEIPFWNRYGHAGDILLGQGVSMLGDPLQLIVILGRGAAGAWDVKFLMAKLLFCIGFGWLVLRRLDNPGLAAIYAALGAYCGAYIFIYNHPVFFVMAYGPWILLAAIEMLAGDPKQWLKWAALWLAANIFCFNAGHPETAVILIGGLNLTSLVYALISCPGWPDRARILARLGGGTLLFLGLTAPVWISFAAALPQAYTVHDQIRVTQLPPGSFCGLFDDYFYHCFLPDYVNRASPGTSLLVLVGCLLSLLRWRHVKADRLLWVNTGAIVIWAGCVFGLVPGRLIALVPFLNRVGHIYVDFSHLLVIQLTLQSAYGFKSLLMPDSFRRAAIDLLAAAALLAAIIGVYYFTVYVKPFYFLYLGPTAAGAIGAAVLFKYLRSRPQPIGRLGWTVIILLGFIPQYRFGLYTFGNDALAILPGPRVVLNPPIETLAGLDNGGDPFRIIGKGWNLVGDYAAVYGLEDVRSCAPLSNARFIELVQHFPGFSLPANDWKILLVNPVAARPLLNLLNIKYVLAYPATPAPETGGTVDFTVVENDQAWPRAFFTSQIVTVASTAEFIQELQRRGDHPFVALDRDEADRAPELRPLEQDTSAPAIPAEHYRLLPNSTEFDIRTTAPGVVCLTEGQANGFLARANGQPVKILTVNRAFKGVYLPEPGTYHMEFRYRPPHWHASLSLFWLSAGILLILGAREYQRARGKRAPVTSANE